MQEDEISSELTSSGPTAPTPSGAYQSEVIALNSRVYSVLSKGRISRYSTINLAGITVRKAVTEADFEVVARLREEGFSRIAPKSGVPSPNGWIDDVDRQVGVFSLIGYNNAGEPVATMRVQDGRISTLELGRFVSCGLPPFF
jgi:hypothetical protein